MNRACIGAVRSLPLARSLALARCGGLAPAASRTRFLSTEAVQRVTPVPPLPELQLPEEEAERDDSLKPNEVVEQLDRYIIGQAEAKKATAVAIRNRWRRQQVPSPLREEITPKNILMIGPTGVGKTEIARRMAKMIGAPFIKVEATKFTEVGFVGRDVEQIIRDLVDSAIIMVRGRGKERGGGEEGEGGRGGGRGWGRENCGAARRQGVARAHRPQDRRGLAAPPGRSWAGRGREE
jgi:hypothetical protein